MPPSSTSLLTSAAEHRAESLKRHSERGATKRSCNKAKNPADEGPRTALLTANEAQSTHFVGIVRFDNEACEQQDIERRAITDKCKSACLCFCIEIPMKNSAYAPFFGSKVQACTSTQCHNFSSVFPCASTRQEEKQQHCVCERTG